VTCRAETDLERIGRRDVSDRSRMALGALWTRLDAASPVFGHFLAMRLLAFLSTTTKNRINPTLSNDTRNGTVIINLSLLQ
jgi:hypothetical protein